MNTARLRKYLEPSQVQQLLDAFVRDTQQLGESDQPIRNRSALSAALQHAVVHAERADEAWSAWSSRFRTRLLTAALSLERSRECGCPVLEIRSYDERTGRVLASSLYMLTETGAWVRCVE